MPPEQIEQVGQWLVLIVIGLALAIGLGSMLLGRVMSLWDRVVGQRDFTSSSGGSEALQRPSSERQTADSEQTDTKPQPQLAITEERRAALIALYRLLRESEIGREKARPILKALDVPLDNNLWTAAKPEPAPSPDARTPIAGRPFDPSLYDDPALRYVPPSSSNS